MADLQVEQLVDCKGITLSREHGGCACMYAAIDRALSEHSRLEELLKSKEQELQNANSRADIAEADSEKLLANLQTVRKQLDASYPLELVEHLREQLETAQAGRESALEQLKTRISSVQKQTDAVADLEQQRDRIAAALKIVEKRVVELEQEKIEIAGTASLLQEKNLKELDLEKSQGSRILEQTLEQLSSCETLLTHMTERNKRTEISLAERTKILKEITDERDQLILSLEAERSEARKLKEKTSVPAPPVVQPVQHVDTEVFKERDDALALVSSTEEQLAKTNKRLVHLENVLQERTVELGNVTTDNEKMSQEIAQLKSQLFKKNTKESKETSNKLYQANTLVREEYERAEKVTAERDNLRKEIKKIEEVKDKLAEANSYGHDQYERAEKATTELENLREKIGNIQKNTENQIREINDKLAQADSYGKEQYERVENVTAECDRLQQMLDVTKENLEKATTERDHLRQMLRVTKETLDKEI